MIELSKFWGFALTKIVIYSKKHRFDLALLSECHYYVPVFLIRLACRRFVEQISRFFKKQVDLLVIYLDSKKRSNI